MQKQSQGSILAEIFSAAGRYVIEGGDVPRFVGDEVQAQAIRRATLASRRFYEALCNERSTIDTIGVMFEERKRAAAEFKRVVGQEWRF